MFSGRWSGHRKKQTVESCYKLNINDFCKMVNFNNGEKGTFSYGENLKGTFEITAPYRLQTEDREILLDALITLRYEINGKDVISPLYVSSSPDCYGYKRYWVLCPAYKKNGRMCLKKSYKLYLPQNAKYFCCRECYNLTYTSVQTRDKRVEELLKNPTKLYSIISQPPNLYNPTEYFLGLKAIAKIEAEKTSPSLSQRLEGNIQQTTIS